jgi:hypothetical protein
MNRPLHVCTHGCVISVTPHQLVVYYQGSWCTYILTNNAHKEVWLFATPLLSQIPLQGIERYLGFWSGRFFLSWWFVGAVCWPLLNRLSVVSRGKGWCRIPAVLNPKTSSAIEYNVGICLVVPFCYLLIVGNCSSFPTQWLLWLWLFSAPK